MQEEKIESLKKEILITANKMEEIIEIFDIEWENRKLFIVAKIDELKAMIYKIQGIATEVQNNLISLLIFDLYKSTTFKNENFEWLILPKKSNIQKSELIQMKQNLFLLKSRLKYLFQSLKPFYTNKVD